MTPKEKAKELTDMYLPYVECFSSEQQDENAKRCALIAVDEIIEVTKELANEEIVTPVIIYWLKVKQEIEKI